MKRRLKPAAPVVRRAWMTHWPARPYSFWVDVAKAMKRERARHNDVEKLKEICRTIDTRYA